MDRLIHTPEGVRDVYNQECTKKLYLENQIEQVFHAFGYQDIETPTFEFFDVFGREVGTTPSRELYKFFDRDGNTLVLRPDFTPSIARAASMYFMEETMPIRLCYRGSSFVNSSSYQGRLKESTQMGVELLNDDSAMADAEIIAMTVKVMLDAGLTDFQISIGHVGFFQALAEEAALSEDVLNELKELISIKNHFGAEELLAKQNLRSDLFEALRDVPQLFGNAEILEKAKALQEIRRQERHSIVWLRSMRSLKITAMKIRLLRFRSFKQIPLLHRYYFPGLHLRHRRADRKRRPLRCTAAALRKEGAGDRILYCHGISDECTGAPENFSSDCQYENDAALPRFPSAAGRKTCQRAQKQRHGCRAGLLCKGQGSCRL